MRRFVMALLVVAASTTAMAQPIQHGPEYRYRDHQVYGAFRAFPGVPTAQYTQDHHNCRWAFAAVQMAAAFWMASLDIATNPGRQLGADVGSYRRVRSRVEWVADYEAKRSFEWLMTNRDFNGCLQVMEGHIESMRHMVEVAYFQQRPYPTPLTERNNVTPITMACRWPDFYSHMPVGRAIMRLPGAGRNRPGDGAGVCNPPHR